MAKPKNSLILKIVFTRSFYDTLESAMDDELAIAEKKWRVNLDADEEERIKSLSREQLQAKVTSMARSWQFGDKTIPLPVPHPNPQTVKLPDDVSKLAGLELMRDKSQWKIAEEDDYDVVDIEDFPRHIEELMTGWIRTAVFYGVGSEA